MRHAEQFRIWEALEAGAIPVVLQKYLDASDALAPLKELGIDVMAIDSWDHFPEKLRGD